MNPQSPSQQDQSQQKNQPSGYPRPDEDSKKQAGERDERPAQGSEQDKQKSGQKW